MMENKESYRQQQQNELEVIQSIFGGDVVDLRPKLPNNGWKPLDLMIALLPQKGSSGTHEAHVKAKLHIICPSKYPKVSPKISLEETKGLSDIQKDDLKRELNEICEQRKGEVVIYDLAQAVQAFLHKHNKPPCGSFYDQMLIERYKRDEALLQQKAQRLSYEQQLIRDQVLKRKEILRNEDRWRRETRRSMSEQSPKHRLNNPTEMADNINDQLNGCELHLNIDDLRFPAVSREIRRGCCLGHSQNGCISYSGIDSEKGQLLYITEWFFKYSQLESKCTINCKNDLNKCGGHSIDEIITGIETEIMHLSQIRHKNLVTYEGVSCLRRKEGVIIYLLQEFVHGTSVNCITNALGWSNSGVSVVAKGIIEALIYLHNNGISHSNIHAGSVFIDNLGVCRVTDFSFITYMHYLMGVSKMSEQTGGDLPALGHLIESMLQLPNPDMFDFIEQCKSERTLTASDLLEHPFLLPDRLNDAVVAPFLVREKKVSDLVPMHTQIHTSTGRSRLETEFEVLQWLGQGAYGDVLKVKNILDNRQYAIKRIPLTAHSRQIFKKMTREVELLSRLNHENVVRYFNSWIENSSMTDLKKYAQIDQDDDDNENDSATNDSGSENQLCMISKPNEDTSNDWIESPLNDNDFSSDGIEFVNSDGEVIGEDDEDDDDEEEDDENDDNDNKQVARSPKNEIQIMYIQMEFCEKSTLRIAIDNNLYSNTERLWRLFREIIEGLAHIHSQGMIHRDLKPVNIFLDSRDQVKIGDFGLATTSFLALQQNHDVSQPNNRGDISSSQQYTGKVGTALYVAPELMGKASNSKYNQKVDLYSLGIIFFEMCHRPFSTGMERVEILAALRSPKIQLPTWMENDAKYNQQVKVIKWLLNHDQNKRPTAEELLASDLLPPARLEDNELQEMLRHVLANPQSKSYKHLVARCLAQKSDTVLELTYHLGMVETNSTLEFVKRQITSLFHRHGAMEVVTPLLSPYVKSTKMTAVRLMTHSGSVVVLPHDLRVPFIKHIALSGINSMRRYSVGRIYREKKVFNFHPKQLYECAFDIITPCSTTESTHDKNRLIDAELISIGYELTDILPLLKQQNLSFRLNHTSLLTAILMNYNVPREKYNDVFVVISDYSDRRISKFQLNTTITALLESSSKHNITSLLDILLTETTLGKSQHYLNSSSLGNFIKGHSEASKMARAAMEEIDNVVSLTQSLGVTCPINLYAGLTVGYEQAKNGGIIWQMICNCKNKNPIVLGIGGRYDYMLSEYQKQAHNRGVTIPNRNISGAGLSFALDKILGVLSAAYTDNVQRIDVVVCVSGTRPNFRDVTHILRTLWSNQIQCAIVQANNIEDVQDMAKELGAIYYIISTDDGILRVRSWLNGRFEERLLNRIEIISYIQKVLRPEPELNVPSATNNTTESNKYHRNSGTLAELSLPAIDISFCTIEKMTTSARKRHENFLTSHMSESLLAFNKRENVAIIVADLQPTIIRALISCIDPRATTNSKEIDNELSFVIERFPIYKRHIKEVIEEINDIYAEKKRAPIICLYSLKDSYYRFIL